MQNWPQWLSSAIDFEFLFCGLQMPKMTRLFAVLLLLVSAFAMVVPAQAQLMLPKSETSEKANSNTGLDVLLDEARRDGSTVGGLMKTPLTAPPTCAPKWC